MKPIEKRGLFLCPFKCGDSRFPAPKWKTEAGVRRHMETCAQRPEQVAAREAAAKARAEQEKQRKAAALAAARFKVGDEIHCVRMYVRKPTHEKQRGRMVRVRYEEEREYSAATLQVTSVTWSTMEGILYNHSASEGDIFDSLEEARKQARIRQDGYNEHCRLADECR